MSSVKPSKEFLEALAAAERAVAENARADLVYGVRAGAPPLCAWPLTPCVILFLDFDGVLNSEQSTEELGTRYKFSRPSVNALNFLLDNTDARIVITSTWREYWTLSENAQSLEQNGVLPNRVLGKTALLGKERGLEIDAWLNDVPFPLRSFVIIDDREDMAHHSNRLVRVDPKVGLTMERARRAIEILAMPWNCHPPTESK
jgi:hypothetical protein